MRCMLKAKIPVEAGNRAIKDGTLQQTIERVVELLKPEAVYFTADTGSRCGLFFFDMTDSSQLPSIAEPLFMNLNATLEVTPVMNPDDLEKGLAEAVKRGW
ncbi:hypothetical protein K8I61_15070 [bacterium]|nr:hypothetical protein [bacterium]